MAGKIGNKVITYASPSGDTINISRLQRSMLTDAGIWPRNDRGEEFSKITRHLHFGCQTWGDDDILEMIARHSKKESNES